jgi:dTDP-4-amino-4,6-dideoxygalactose transaminase
LAIWDRYHAMLAPLEQSGLLRRPIIPADCQHNGHIYYALLAPGIDRQAVLRELKNNGISAVFHYVPLHSAPAGQRYGRADGGLQLTTALSERLIRLPMWVGLGENQQQRVCDVLGGILKK